MATEFPDVPNYTSDHAFLLKHLVMIVRNLMQGRSNNLGTVTLTPNSTTTTVDLALNELGPNTAVFFMPTTANAATEFGAGAMYVSARNPLSTSATFTITHTNNAQTDRTFLYALFG